MRQVRYRAARGDGVCRRYSAAALRTERPKRIFVSALDTGGRPVADLTAADFQITEDGVKRTVTRVTSGGEPLRIVLMVDSSTPTAPMMNNFRIALNGFVDMLPPEHEISFITTGGQIRVRTQPSADREQLKAEIATVRIRRRRQRLPRNDDRIRHPLPEDRRRRSGRCS